MTEKGWADGTQLLATDRVSKRPGISSMLDKLDQDGGNHTTKIDHPGVLSQRMRSSEAVDARRGSPERLLKVVASSGLAQWTT